MSKRKKHTFTLSEAAKKKLALNLPYFMIGLYATKLGQAWRMAEGTNLSEKLLHLGDGFASAFASSLPSFHPADLLVGLLAELLLRLAVYKASGWSRSFFAEHESEIRQYKQALLTFDEAGYKTVPKLKVLYDMLGQLKVQRRKLIGDYAAAKKTKQELLTVQANLNALLPQNEKERIRSDAERS